MKHVTVTQRTKNAEAKIQAALTAGYRVMSHSPNGTWFLVVAFRVERSEGYDFWYATPKNGGHLSGGAAALLVRSVNWDEPEMNQKYYCNTRVPQA